MRKKPPSITLLTQFGKLKNRCWSVIITTWMYWSMVELGLSITAACLLTLRLLFQDSSFQGWRKGLRSYIQLLSNPFSARPSSFSTLDGGPLTNLHKGSEQHSNASQVGTLAPNAARMATNIYPMHDVEAQTGMSPASITVRSKIEQTSSIQ